MKKALFILFTFVILGTGQSPARVTTTLPDSGSVNRRILAAAILTETAFYLGGMSYLQFIWYKDHERVPFHFYNDMKGWLQVDKLGHVYGAYIESYIGYHWLRRAGVRKGPALLYGGTLGLLLQTPIEIFDALYEGWGFSWGDMAANTIGSALVVGQELLFDQQLLKYKFSYWKSAYLDQANGYLGNNGFDGIFYDYNGHSYWLSLPLNKIIPVKKIPDWLCLSAGYSANGMFGEFTNMRYYHGAWIPETERYRQYLLSLDIDWTRIKTRSPLLRKILDAMVFIKLPFPAIEFSSLGRFRGYWVYF